MFICEISKKNTCLRHPIMTRRKILLAIEHQIYVFAHNSQKSDCVKYNLLSFNKYD